MLEWLIHMLGGLTWVDHNQKLAKSVELEGLYFSRKEEFYISSMQRLEVDNKYLRELIFSKVGYTAETIPIASQEVQPPIQTSHASWPRVRKQLEQRDFDVKRELDRKEREWKDKGARPVSEIIEEEKYVS